MGRLVRRSLPLLFISTIALGNPSTQKPSGFVGAIKTIARAPRTFASGFMNSFHATFGSEFGGFSRALRTAKQVPTDRLRKLRGPVVSSLAHALTTRSEAFKDRAGAGEQFVRVVTAHGSEPGHVMSVLSRLGIYHPSQLPKTITG